jgi:hypothetical protein
MNKINIQSEILIYNARPEALIAVLRKAEVFLDVTVYQLLNNDLTSNLKLCIKCFNGTLLCMQQHAV